MSVKHTIAAESLVFTATGPCAAGSLRVDAEVLGVDMEGRITSTPVAEPLRPDGAAPVMRVLTRAGEALLPVGAEVAGATGSIPVGRLPNSSAGIEIIAPADLPPTSAMSCSPLDGLLPGRFLIPLDNGAGEALEGRIAAAVARLGLEVEQREEFRWLVVGLSGVPSRSVSWTWDDERHLLEALCGWEVDGSQVSSARARLDQRTLRRRLVAAYAACGRSFHTDWLPGYLPSECRIKPSGEQPPAFAQAERVLPERGPVVILETMKPCSLIVGPLIVRARKDSR